MTGLMRTKNTKQQKSSSKGCFLSLNAKKSGQPTFFLLAGGRGFEPLQTDSESVVLPLDEPPLNASLSYSDFIVQGIFL